jgi:hypothetical protein
MHAWTGMSWYALTGMLLQQLLLMHACIRACTAVCVIGTTY